MKRCYENYWFAIECGKEVERYNHCGFSTHDESDPEPLHYYCTTNGKIPGYACRCGAIEEPESLRETQLSFF